MIQEPWTDEQEIAIWDQFAAMRVWSTVRMQYCSLACICDTCLSKDEYVYSAPDAYYVMP